MTNDSNPVSFQARPCWKARLRRIGWRLVKFVLLLLVSYGVILLVGLLPVNSDFQPAEDGVKIYITSTALHAGIVLPIQTDQMDWRTEFPAGCFEGNIESATYLEFGWGDRQFCIDTPTWADMRISTAANALFIPSATSLHVVMTRPELLSEGTRTVTISREQYSELVKYIESSFKLVEGKRIQISVRSYGDNDAFFESKGRYHLLNTCNSWVGGAMKSAGIKTPWLTSLPKSPFLYLPE